MTLYLCILLAVFILGILIYIQQPKFGKLPTGARLERVSNSPNYDGNEFKNLEPTTVLTDGKTTFSVIIDGLLNPPARLKPETSLPTIKTNLHELPANQEIVIWLGHSSFYVQLSGKRFLIDPVFSKSAAPIDIANQSFKGTNIYSADDMPNIDYLLITHDHWDHLDYPTIKSLYSKVSHVVTGLGLGENFEHWGYPKNKITELDWFESLKAGNEIVIHSIPARHYSGRLLKKNKTLWTGYALISPKQKILFSGDSGYGAHFSEIQKRFGEFNLVALDAGQYDRNWSTIHMFPEQAVQAAEDLNAQALILCHVGKFSIAKHSWDEPFNRIVKASTNKAFKLLTPEIGAAIFLDTHDQKFTIWWKDIESELVKSEKDADK